MERIKYYSINDITCSEHLKNLEKVLREYGEGREVQSINDAIELFNINKFIENKIYLKVWKEEDILYFERICKQCFGMVAKFFNTQISNESIKELFQETERCYKSDFWEMIEKFKVYEKISPEKFQDLIGTTEIDLYDLLRQKKIIEHFGEIIREYMLKHSFMAEIILNKYEMKHNRGMKPIYLPKELTNKDKEAIILRYIDSAEANLNYLRLIANIQSCKDKIDISARTILKSKKKVEEEEKRFFEENSGIRFETVVAFSKQQEETVISNLEGQNLSLSYSQKWIEENDDYATLLNNFIYLFEFVDLQMRFNMVNKVNNMGAIERHLTTRSKNAYITGIIFERLNQLTFLQITGYYRQLFSMGIRLEEVIEWFFNDYLPDSFMVYGFRIAMPSVNSTMLEKCTNVMPALESILKQFSLYVQEGQIDFELLEIRSEHLLYENIPSLNEKKYVYGFGDEFKKSTFLLFSDQSGLGYYEGKNISYSNFFELLCNEKIKEIDYPGYHISEIKWLVEQEYLAIDDDEYVVFNDDYNQILILKDLFYNEVISYWNYHENIRVIIDKLEKKKLIEFESSLFSKPEQDYINYFLNKSKFNNGLDLRNKYAHTQPKCDESEKIHTQSYMMFLRIFILSIIKINDDFVIAKEIRCNLNDINP
ncbi:MAG: hypothetical protein H6Q58_420 [Firmicutes bacterium]|nr:hypothetical protein [Bacillota bacterium]